MAPYIKLLKDISIGDIALVGGNNSSLGEMFSELSSKCILVSDGFATIAFVAEIFLNQSESHLLVKT